LETVYNIPQTQEIDTPPSYILVIANIVVNGQSFQGLLAALPENKRPQVSKVIAEFGAGDRDDTQKIDNTFYNNLSDVKWEMFIENGREIWEIKLYTYENPNKPFKMRLNYEQLSVLTFQISQVINQIGHIQNR